MRGIYRVRLDVPLFVGGVGRNVLGRGGGPCLEEIRHPLRAWSVEQTDPEPTSVRGAHHVNHKVQETLEADEETEEIL